MSPAESPISGSSHSKRKRNRVPLSCTICRKRKVKCDKGRPHCKQCEKTGVAHLCHYMEQSWAEEAEKELSKDAELKQLRERVKALEETLSKVHANGANSPCSISNQSPILTSELRSAGEKSVSGDKYENDELDLTRQFDMLHLKNNGTIHLGATHWLAIMKGDPYLKLLWGHIFTLREKINEWYSQKRKPSSAYALSTTSKCPVIHTQTQDSGCPISSIGSSLTREKVVSEDRGGKCPIDHSSLSRGESDDPRRKCPVAHNGISEYQPIGCPVQQQYVKKEEEEEEEEEEPCQTIYPAHNTKTSEKPNDVKKCPINITRTSVTDDKNTASEIKLKHPILPSFQNLAARCPVVHDSTPPPPPPPKNISNTSSGRTSIATTLNATFEQACEKIAKLIPPKKIIAPFLDKFFNHLYPVIPILDEQNFKSQVSQIVQTMDEQTTLKVSKPSDACVLGILLIILRITWLSLPPNACKVDLGPALATVRLEPTYASTVSQAKEESLLLNFETPVETIELARKVLIKFDEISSFANSNVNMTTVQFAIFYKLYLLISPDKTKDTSPNTFTSTGQDNETHQVLMSSIVQMAFSCGLHRDPDNFPQINSAMTPGKLNKELMANAERLKHTWRKTWFFIVSLDVQQSLSLGTPRLLRNLSDFSDTKLPCASKIDYVNDIKELIVVKNFTLFFQIDLCIISVLNHILNVSLARTVRKFELDQLISCLGKLRSGQVSTNEVINELVNKGLLFTTEGTSLLDQAAEYSYSLPSLESVISAPNVNSLDDKEKKLNLPHEVTTTALFFSKHIVIGMLQYLLNYILFTHYEPMGNEDHGTRSLARDYAQEALNFAMEGYKNCVMFYNSVRSNTMFNYMEVLLSPVCLDVGHRALQFIVCLILRAKCGPLTGMGESPAVSAATSSTGNTSGSEDEIDGQRKHLLGERKPDLLNIVRLDVGEKLADILMERMLLFHKLTKQVSNKYTYASRMNKSTGFFITLLKKPSSKGKNALKIKNSAQLQSHPTIANMTGFFKNVPSLILSAGGDQIRRCPVYQDAIGFLPSKVSSGTFNSVFSNGTGSQLPPLSSQYRPITFRDTFRRTSDLRDDTESTKRRKIDQRPHLYPAPPSQDVRSESVRKSLTASPSLDATITSLDPLPPVVPKAADVTGSSLHFSPSPSDNGNQPILAAMNFETPAPNSDISTVSPDFEDFLMENSSLNGLMINPSSIVEAVGFDGYGANDLELQTDFLPIDNNESLNDLTTAADFSMWN